MMLAVAVVFTLLLLFVLVLGGSRGRRCLKIAAGFGALQSSVAAFVVKLALEA
jgi:hypothetical protein